MTPTERQADIERPFPDDVEPLAEEHPERANMREGRNDTGLGALIPPQFLRKIAQTVTSDGAGTPAGIQSQVRGSLAKFWFGSDPSVHYEIWLHGRTNQLELGLHMESTAEYNRSLYMAFDRCLLDIQERLGPQFWLEEWDHGWVRLYETHPLQPMDAVRVEEVASRMNEIIAVLQPMLTDITSGLTPPVIVPAERTHGRGWRKRR